MPRLTRIVFRLIAYGLRNGFNRAEIALQQRHEITEEVIAKLRETNPRFDPEVFHHAAGSPPAPIRADHP